ncbi:MAG: branched-chain amino acid ABC transporter permease [Aggregatilineales bacterium]
MTQTLSDYRRYLIAAGYLVVVLLLLAWLGPLLAAQQPFRLVQSTITGVLVGGLYALVALGIVVINKSSGVFNFAHGWMMLIGGLVFYTFFTSAQVSPLVALALAALTVLLMLTTLSANALRSPRYLAGGAVAVVVLTLMMTVTLPGNDLAWLHAVVGAATGSVLLGLLIERLTIRPLIGQPLITAVLMTLAVSEVLRGITQLTWGSVQINLPIFAELNPLGMPQRLAPIRIDAVAALGGTIIVDRAFLVAFALALVAFTAFVLFFRFTNVGLAMRGTAENQQLAQSVGLRVRSILAAAWAIAALLATVGGVLLGGATSLTVTLPFVALRAFPAVLLGGLESIAGALLGGLVIGLTEQYATLLFPGTQAGEQLAPYVVLMVVLILRPEGLFGQKRVERI